MPDILKEFLKETEFCDYSHPDIQKLAHEIAAKYDNPKDKAIALFYWVRNNILYRVGMWNRKASETLAEKEGTCTNKSNLLVALLRANNIHAGYGVMKVNGQEYFGPIILPIFKKWVSKESVHIYCYVRIKDRWIKIDPSPDKKLSDNTSYYNPTTIHVEWDGFNDATEKIDPSHILDDSKPISNIDYLIKKIPKNAKGIPLKVGNLYILFVRNNAQKINNIKELELLFKQWLRKNYFLYFYLILIISWCKDLELKFKRSKNKF